MSDYTEERVDRVAEAIAKAADADYWTDEIAEWENAEEWYREAYPCNHPNGAYEDREQFRKQARAALKAAFTAGQERATEAQPRGKSCAVNACRHAARWQDSGSVDYCACHYDDSAADEECAAGQEEQS